MPDGRRRRGRGMPVMVDLADFMAVDGWFSNDVTYQFNAERAWDEYQQDPEKWDNLAVIMTKGEGRPWDAVDVIVAAVGPWWVPADASGMDISDGVRRRAHQAN